MLYRLVALLLLARLEDGKELLCTPALPHNLETWKVLRCNSEVIWADGQDPGGDAKSQVCFLYTGDFIHTFPVVM